MASVVESEEQILFLKPKQLTPLQFTVAALVVLLIAATYALIADRLDLLLWAAALVGFAFVWMLDSWRFSHLRMTDRRIIQSRALGLLTREVLLDELSVGTREMANSDATPAIRLTSPRTTIEVNPYTFGAQNINLLVGELVRRGYVIPGPILQWLDWELNPNPDG
jgi:hypothetical protein